MPKHTLFFVARGPEAPFDILQMGLARADGVEIVGMAADRSPALEVRVDAGSPEEAHSAARGAFYENVSPDVLDWFRLRVDP